jgi:ribosome biogenesis GTPase
MATSAAAAANVPNRQPEFGWDDRFEQAFAEYGREGFLPGRVVGEHRGGYRVATAGAVLSAETSGRLRYAALGRADYPVVGDWVAIAGPAIQAVLDRRSVFRRQDPGGGEQLLAANVDVAFLVTSLNRDFNLRRLERYLAMAWTSGAQPVVILSKADLSGDLDGPIADVERVAVGVPTIAVSAAAGTGLDQVRAHLVPGRTAVFLGSSGVGKSTLINALAGRSIQAVREIRADDDRGRHATTGRQLIALPAGWLVIDTPGLRSIGLTDAGAEDGLDRTFADIEGLAAGCRFSDCRHVGEPGCAVQAAIRDGSLGRDRLASHRKLEREAARSSLGTDRGARAANRAKWRAIHRAVDAHMDRKYGADR